MDTQCSWLGGVVVCFKPRGPGGLLKVLRDARVLGPGNKDISEASSDITPSVFSAGCLENLLVSAGDRKAATIELPKAGWELIDFLPKLAREYF